MRKIAIAGAGGFSKEVLLSINDVNKRENRWQFLGFFDDKVPKGDFFMGYMVLGNINDLNQIDEEIDVIIAAGRSSNIISILGKLKTDKLVFPNLIHPNTEFIHKDSLIMGRGNIIQPYSSLSADNKIGNFNVFNASVRVGHDTIIGDYNTFATATLISGGVKIGDQNDFGMSSGILQYKSVGNRNVIAPMSVLFRSVKDGGHYMGVPARDTKV